MKISSRKLTISSPVKLNLHLAVKDKRPDGYHSLESVFMALDYGDTLHLEFAAKNSLVIDLEGVKFAVPMEENIIFKAVSLFRSKTGFDQGVRINLKKCVPPAGGLGGGSSNAASILLGLNVLSGAKLNHKKLLEMAVSLGSDVPFFINQIGAAWVSGRGEYVNTVKPPKCFCVLVYPGFSSDTNAAYKLLDQCREGSGGTKEAALTEKECLKALSGKPESWPFKNDFLAVSPDSQKTVYQNIFSKFSELGASFSGLSGTGSTCFGIFTKMPQAEKAVDALKKNWDFVRLALPAKKGAVIVSK